MEKYQGKRKISRALVSLYHKEWALPFCRFLHNNGVELIASGGTAKYLAENGIKVTKVADVTRFHDILNGRVKTLHPAIFGGILARRNKEEDIEELKRLGIITIDLLILNLYPFKKAISEQQSLEKAVELIDIGGSALLRAGAKNFHDVTVVTNEKATKKVKQELEDNAFLISLETRHELAIDAFTLSSNYDSSITNYLSSEMVERKEFEETKEPFFKELSLELYDSSQLKYGENPHQMAAIYRVKNYKDGFAGFKDVSGRKLSFNNFFDLFAAYQLVWEFTQPAVAIIKHATPCGVAANEELSVAYSRALACDPLSAYGSIIATNRIIDAETASLIHKTRFVEAVISPEFDETVLKKLMRKKKRRFIACPPPKNDKTMMYRWIGGLFLAQEKDNITYLKDSLQTVTKREPTENEMKDLLFAWIAAKHVRSNAILLAKNNASVGIGGGQTSRVDSCKIAIDKAGERSFNAVLASDAFFPFRDSIDLAHSAGITSVIQPGGSIRDEEVIDACNEHDMAMVFTKIRHFKHQ